MFFSYLVDSLVRAIDYVHDKGYAELMALMVGRAMPASPGDLKTQLVYLLLLTVVLFMMRDFLHSVKETMTGIPARKLKDSQ